MNTIISGTGVALITPFKENGSVDHAALEALLDHVTEGGVNFLVAMGTTAESATLDPEERMEVLQLIQEKNQKKLPLVIGVGGNNTRAVVGQLERLDAAAYDAVLSVAPYYNKPTQNGLQAHFTSVIEASPLPVILYNVPGRTSSNISAETCLNLACSSEKVIAVKEASGNLQQVMEILKDAPDHFSLLSGDDNLTFPMLALGASGVISVSGQLVPKLFSKMMRLALSGQMEAARSIHYKLFALTDLLFQEGNPAGVKAGLSILGVCEKAVRLPLVARSQDLHARIQKELEELNGLD